MTQLGQILRHQIVSDGAIPWERFMAMALYHPELGYYETIDPGIGPGGDFLTHASFRPLFGRLLAAQFAEWLAEITEGPCQIVEVGAHRGDLAHDILQAMQRLSPRQFLNLEYCILECSSRRRSWQQSTLGSFAPRVRWIESIEHVGAGAIRGVLFCNEFLDALPIRRLAWDAHARTWFEWGVGSRDGLLCWERLPVPPCVLDQMWCECDVEHASELASFLPDGYTLDWSPSAAQWWRLAARSLERGCLVAMDYGWENMDWLRPERVRGSLRGYRKHRLVEDVLAEPGYTDLTAHVNFTQIRKAGESCGLTTAPLETQERFLGRVLGRLWPARADYLEEVPQWKGQFQMMCHPDCFGRAFRVLRQTRGRPQTVEQASERQGDPQRDCIS